MTATERRPLIDYLPAVLREGDARTNGFLGRFLAAFEAVFHGVEEEIDALPHLFSLAPTPSLASDAFAPDPNAPPGTERFTGSLQLRLDSATRICPGDVVQIEDVTRPVVAFTVPADVSAEGGVRARPQRPRSGPPATAAGPAGCAVRSNPARPGDFLAPGALGWDPAPPALFTRQGRAGGACRLARGRRDVGCHAAGARPRAPADHTRGRASGSAPSSAT